MCGEKEGALCKNTGAVVWGDTYGLCIKIILVKDTGDRNLAEVERDRSAQSTRKDDWDETTSHMWACFHFQVHTGSFIQQLEATAHNVKKVETLNINSG